MAQGDGLMREHNRRGEKCDRPDCDRMAEWFVGLELEGDKRGLWSRGHSSCGHHLGEACSITLLQLISEGLADAHLDVRPMTNVVLP
jgi:hypothetical protein